MTTKQEHFLWIVQTAILAEKHQDNYSPAVAKNLMVDAVRASELIPEDKTAAEAADDFCLWMLHSLRNIQIEGGEEPTCPAWFAR